jgi:serine/threonine-protein phosphatase PP1 catalytic subunit
VKTENKVLVSHAGPSQHLKSEDDIKNISENDYSHNLILYEMLWSRNMECSRNYLDPFLKHLNCKASIVGHTPVNGVELQGNQLIVSSSFGIGKKAYIELDLKQEINTGRDLLKMVKYLD